MNRKNSMLEALKHEHQLCSCGSLAGPPDGFGHDDEDCGFDTLSMGDYTENVEVNTRTSSASLSSTHAPMTSPSASNPKVFHRKFQSEENHRIKSSVSSTFTIDNQSFRPSTKSTETVDYYQILLRDTEERRQFLELENLLYRRKSSPVLPDFPPPTPPTSVDFEPSSVHGRFFLSRPSSGDEDILDTHPIDGETVVETTDHQLSSIVSSPLAPLNPLNITMAHDDSDTPVSPSAVNRRVLDSEHSVEEHSTHEDSPVSTQSHRSPEPRKFKRGSKRPLKPFIPNQASSSPQESSSEAINANPDQPGSSSETMELRRAAESIADIVDETDIQSRPLPPIPLDQESFDDEYPEEPDEKAPSPPQSVVQDTEHAYETVIHKRCSSDHVLATVKIPKKASSEKPLSDLKKSNSDRSPESPPPNKSLSKNSSISVSTPMIAPSSDGLRSPIRHPERHSYYPPTSYSDGRKRSPGIDASSSDTPKGSRARLSPTESDLSVRIRPDSKSLSQRSSNTRSCTEISPAKKATFSSLVSRLTAKKSDSSLGSSSNLSTRSDKEKEKKFGFKWKNFFGSSKSSSSSFDDTRSISGSPVGRSLASNAPLTRSASSSSAKFLTRYDDSRTSPRLMTLPENEDISTPWHGESPSHSGVLRRSLKMFHSGSSASKSPSPTVGRDRRISVIGDLDCDRRMFCVPDEASNKLDQFILKKRLQYIEHVPSRQPSVTLTDDDEVYEEEEARIMDSGRITPEFKTLPRHANDVPRTPNDTNDRRESQPKIRSGKCVKRRRPRELHRRRSAHQIREYPTDTDSGLPAALRVRVPLQRDVAVSITSIDLSITKKKMVKTPLKNYQAPNKKGFFPGLLSLRGNNGKNKKGNKAERGHVASLFQPLPTSPIGQPVAFSGRSGEYSHSVDLSEFPDSLKDAFSYGTTHHKASTSDSDGLRTPLGYGGFFDAVPPSPQLRKPKWNDLDLWEEDPENWSLKYAQDNLKVTTSEAKRQNVIYELYQTEKKHTRVIIFLQQAYQVGMRSLKILTEEQMIDLIPDVLDSMLDFHLNVLRRLRSRMELKPVVDTVSDILAEEFSPEGRFVNTAIQAYTNFCVSKDDSCAYYQELIEKNPRVKKFFEFYETNPEHKKHGFKSCLLLITQRLTKYTVLVSEILKYDCASASPTTKIALTAVQEFARRINTELQRNDILKRWDKLKDEIDKRTKGKLLHRDFGYDDLVLDERDVLAIGEAEYTTSTVNHKDRTVLTLLLCDDIIAFFSHRGSSRVFCNHNLMSSVIPLKRVLIREVPRSCEFHLVMTDAERPDMYKLSFPNKNHMTQWIEAIESAKAIAPEFVRLAPGRSPQPQCEESEDPEEKAHASRHADWLNTLSHLFDELKTEDVNLCTFMERRMDKTDDINTHFEKMPTRSVPKLSSSASSSGLASKLERRETREIERARTLVKSKLLEIREQRHLSLDGLLEAAQRCSILSTDFVAELAIASSSESSTGGSAQSGEAGEFLSTGTSSEDEPNSRGSKPRRVRTYHGTSDSQKRDSLRRHTTVPKMKSDGTTETDDEQEAKVDEEYRKLPFVMPLRARKAAKLIIRENVAMKLENSELRNVLAMKEMHIASLRKPALHETGEKLEKLRQRTEEMTAFEIQLRKEQEAFKDEVARKKEQFEEREAALLRREAEIAANQYGKASSLRSGACVLQQPTMSPSESTEMKALILKSKTIPATTTKPKRKQ